eukprot:6431901-Ditylum_brightwellii.AAC.1
MVTEASETQPVSYNQKHQSSAPLPFLDHDFHGYHTTEWYQWEVNVQSLAKGATQMNSGNDVGARVKSLLVKLYAAHRKDTINIFSKTKRFFKVEMIPKTAKKARIFLTMR